jgi:hypothetical protein
MSTRNPNPPNAVYEKRIFVVSAGIFSLVVLLCAGSMHSALLFWGVTHPGEPPEFLLRLMGMPAFIAPYGTVCIGGMILGIAFMNHAWQNPRLSRPRRVLWCLSLACGYGMIFYWWLHLPHGEHSDAVS